MRFLQLYDDPATRQLLDARARELALLEHAADDDEGEEIVVFRLGAGDYTLPASAVQEAQPLDSYTALPATPPAIVGLVNVRGRLLTVLDIRPLLDLPPAPPAQGAVLLRVGVEGVELGLLADSVSEVCRADGELTPPFAAAAGRGAPWVRGIDPQLRLALDPQLLFADPRLVVNDDV